MIAQRFVDAVQAFPWLFLVITVMSLLGPGMIQVIIVLGVPWGIVNIRTVRSVVLSVKEEPYVEAARAAGASTPRILIRHIAPQIVAPMIVLFTISVGGNILAEAGVSFLGFGIPPPEPSWGSMLSLEGRKYMLESPLLAFWPGLCLAIVVFGVTCSEMRYATCSIRACVAVPADLMLLPRRFWEDFPTELKAQRRISMNFRLLVEVLCVFDLYAFWRSMGRDWINDRL